MDLKERRTNTYLIVLLPIAVVAVAFAIVSFPAESVDARMIGLAIVTVFFSGYLRIQLPKTKIHLTISDALIFLAFLLFGGSVAVLLALCEAAYTSLTLKYSGVKMRPRTLIINVCISVISVFAMTLAVLFLYGPTGLAHEADAGKYIWLLALMAFSQFLVNSAFVSAFISVSTDTSPWKIWNEYCLNALVLYVCGSFVAGVSLIAIEQLNLILIGAVLAGFALIYFTYKRSADDVRATFAKAELAERSRAEQAEQHVAELKHYVAELERSGRALRESREKFRHAAFHDSLTDLPNRNKFVALISELLDAYKSKSVKEFAVLFLDLNRFKTLNDSLGHSVGDRLIVSVAERLLNLKSDGLTVGRFSGDEFAILLTNIDGPRDATRLASKLAKKMAEPFALDGRQVFTSVAIGIAFSDAKYNTSEEILRDADIAMYYAKDRQKDFEIFDQSMHALAVSLLDLETDLRYAIERKEFEVHYQPIVNLERGRLEGFEALVRWNHPKRGLVDPAEFIPVAESTGLVIPMTVQILRSACQQIVRWQRSFLGMETLTVSVNLSVTHFSVPGLVEQVAGIIRETGIAPSCLRLEITESAVMTNAEQAIAMLKSIKELGVRISIDDFGTGYSSLSYLHRFPIDTLKVDRSFVSSMESGSENGEIVRTIIALAKALDLSVVAEGIESIHQFHQLRVLGCDYGQGYLFARPLPVHDAGTMLADPLRWAGTLPINEYESIAPNLEYTQLQLPH